MLPRTIYLEYKTANPNYPSRIHTRAAQLVNYEERDHHVAKVTLRSEYDSLRSIVVTFELLGDVGLVSEVRFEETFSK